MGNRAGDPMKWPWILGGAVIGGVLFGLSRRRSGTIFTIVFENKGRREVIGNPDAPFLNSLAQQYANLSNFRSPYHPSLPNYITMVTGGPQGITDDVGHRIPGVNNLAAQMDAAGIAWRAYGESMPHACFAGDTNLYALRHMPFMYLDYVRQDPNYCAQKVVPFDQFWADLGSYQYQWITPNVINDMHDGTVAQGDAWANAVIPAIMSSDAYLNNGVIFILFDETEGSESTMPAIVVSESLSGSGSDLLFDQTSYFQGVEDLLGLPGLPYVATGAHSLAELIR